MEALSGKCNVIWFLISSSRRHQITRLFYNLITSKWTDGIADEPIASSIVPPSKLIIQNHALSSRETKESFGAFPRGCSSLYTPFSNFLLQMLNPHTGLVLFHDDKRKPLTFTVSFIQPFPQLGFSRFVFNLTQLVPFWHIRNFLNYVQCQLHLVSQLFLPPNLLIKYFIIMTTSFNLPLQTSNFHNLLKLDWLYKVTQITYKPPI